MAPAAARLNEHRAEALRGAKHALEEAVTLSAQCAQTGDAVLLSPACASFDMFRNYEHRAQVFIDAVQRLANVAGDRVRTLQ